MIGVGGSLSAYRITARLLVDLNVIDNHHGRVEVGLFTRQTAFHGMREDRNTDWGRNVFRTRAWTVGEYYKERQDMSAGGGTYVRDPSESRRGDVQE